MLQSILDLFRANEGATFTTAAVATRLDIPPDVVEQMLGILERKGRLCWVGEDCNTCAPCPLKSVCAGGPKVAQRGYTLAESPSLSPTA